MESDQLLNEDGEHAFDFDGLLGELFVVVSLEQFQISGQQELIFQFTGRTSCNNTKPGQAQAPIRATFPKPSVAGSLS